eukprot:TRINITY_DN596_c0_g1_i5.p1 TRINITY_DN596_c0_g1~~TRINITY_DN596_c0_g1_i5.p1  ORF type:complete len:750 (-),score=168.38 TRINITY_DN596_c0_g1_i5:8-2017(-)
MKTDYFHLGIISISPDHSMLVFGIDTYGNERFDLSVKNLDTGEFLPDKLMQISRDLEWSQDNSYFFYVVADESEREYRCMRHKIGTGVEEDVIMFEEERKEFAITIVTTCSKQYMLLTSSSQSTSITYYRPAHDPALPFSLLFPLQESVIFNIDHDGGQYFYVLTNQHGSNNCVVRFPTEFGHDASRWEVVVPVRDFVLIERFEMRARHLVLYERSAGMQNIRIINIDENGELSSHYYVHFPEVIYALWPGGRLHEDAETVWPSTPFQSNSIRFTYTSLVQPKQVIEYNMDTRAKSIISVQKVPGYRQEAYVQRRLFATSIDGTAVPISLVFRKDLVSYDSPSYCILHAYGAYCSSLDPVFSAVRLSLLDRGFIFALAHVRGGAEMGSQWYEAGKLNNRCNTFHDFVACAEFLIKEGYTSQDKLAIYGRSAGGTLIGAVLNMRPDICKSALMVVPFVDVLNTMLDPELPNTIYEYDEWGNPEDATVYNLIKSYCPYTNISAQHYPNIFIRSGLNDSRVQYWESLKYVAKLRAQKTDKNHLWLSITDSGHGGQTGQYGNLEEHAIGFACLIFSLGAREDPVALPVAATLAPTHNVPFKGRNTMSTLAIAPHAHEREARHRNAELSHRGSVGEREAHHAHAHAKKPVPVVNNPVSSSSRRNKLVRWLESLF